MFIAVLFIIVKIWKQPKCPLVDERLKKLLYIYKTEYYVAVKKEGILTFCDGMDGTGTIMLSEISQSVKDKYHMISLIWGIE